MSLGLETREEYWAGLLSAWYAFLNLKMADQVCWKPGDKKVRGWRFQIQKKLQQKIPMNVSQLFKVFHIVHWKIQITIVNSPTRTMFTVTEPKLPSGAMPGSGQQPGLSGRAVMPA